MKKEKGKGVKAFGLSKMLLLGLQHMFAMFGATILVPIIVNGYFKGEGLSVQVALFAAGVGTLIFHLVTKGKVPAFLGSSFAFLGGFAAVAALNSGKYADMTMGEKLPYACGGIVVAGLLYFILATIIRLAGVQSVMRFLPPVVTGPIIICIGLSLAPSAVANASQNWLLAGDGLATAFAGAVGGPANTTYGENTGVLELSGVHDPRVIRVRNVVENHVDFTKSRNLVIAAVILVSGLGFTDGLTFSVGNAQITLTSLAIAAILGVLLNAVLPENDS